MGGGTIETEPGFRGRNELGIEAMNLKHTRVQHEGAGNWVVDFIGDDGEAVSVKVREHKLLNQDEVVEQAKRIMIE